jgi:HSF-type DNA-binding
MSDSPPMHRLNRKRRTDIDGEGNASSVDSVDVDDAQRTDSEEVTDKLCGSRDAKKPVADAKEALFQYKLYEILQCEDFKEILTWLPHGRSWKIIDSEALAKYVLPKYFRHSKYSSFKRQMSGWGFRRGIKVNEYNEYNHPVGEIHLMYSYAESFAHSDVISPISIVLLILGCMLCKNLCGRCSYETSQSCYQK